MPVGGVGMPVGGADATHYPAADAPAIDSGLRRNDGWGAGGGGRGPQWRSAIPLGGLFQVVAEFAGAGGVAEFADGFGLDLADALAGYAEFAADFL